MDERLIDRPHSLSVACTYIGSAMKDRRIDHQTDAASLRWVTLYHENWMFIGVVQIALVVYPLLSFFEGRNGTERDWTYLVETLCWIMLAAALTVRIHFTGPARLRRSVFFVLHFLALMIILIDLCYSCFFSHDHYYRYARLLRPVLQLEYAPAVRRRLVDLLKMTSRIKAVMLLLFFHIIFFAVLAVYIFYDSEEGDQHFSSLSDAAVTLVVLLSTCNSPSVMMPAYSEHWYSCFYFIIYLVISVFIVLNLLLAEVYHIHRSLLKEEAQRNILRQTVCTHAAYHALYSYAIQHWEGDEELVGLPSDLIEAFLHQLGIHQSLLEIHESPSGREFVLKEAFTKDILLLVQLSRLSCAPPLSWRSSSRTFLQRMLDHRTSFSQTKSVNTLDMVVNLLVVFSSAVTIGLLATDLSILLENAEPMSYIVFTNLCAVLFVFEIAIKIYVRGMKNFFLKPWNCFDFVVVTLSFASVLISIAGPSLGNKFRAVLFLRQLRLLRLLRSVAIFKSLVDTISFLAPAFVVFSRVMFQFYYLFAIVGMGWFGHISLSPQNFKANDFQTFGASLLTLFELMMINDWNVTMKNFYDATKNPWSQLYFVTWYLFGCIIMLNSITSFTLEALDKHINDRESMKADSESKLRILQRNESFVRIESAMIHENHNLHGGISNLFSHVFHGDVEEPTSLQIKNEIARLGILFNEH